ncbi:MAG: NAD(P)H-dependent oxidoreductase subunit E, partial [Planctomycetes bacterium]|nr:NAD(P)H-dependent oxidoreductase subunit E [Planctomycetota bacterium]
MNASSQNVIREVCQAHDNDRTRLLDIALAVQEQLGCVTSEAVDQIAAQLGCPRVEVQSTVSFYAFLDDKPRGQVVIRLCND